MRMILSKIELSKPKIRYANLDKTRSIRIGQYQLGTMIGMVVIDAHGTVKLLNKHNTY